MARVESLTAAKILEITGDLADQVEQAVAAIGSALQIIPWGPSAWIDRPTSDPDDHYGWFDPTGTKPAPPTFMSGSDIVIRPGTA